MKHLFKTLLLLSSVYVITALTSCKKEHQQSGNIQFDLNGTHHSFTVDGSFCHVVDSANISGKEVQLQNGQNSLPLVAMQFCDAQSDPNNGYISSGSYPDSVCGPCKFFQFQYGDNVIGPVFNDGISNITFANITSTTNGTRLINGTFDCWVTDPSGTVNLHLINGKITNCAY